MSEVSMWKFRASLLAALLAIISAVPLHAQDRNHEIKINVPFAFEYGSRHFSPGIYTIGAVTSNTTLLRSASDSALTMTRREVDWQPAKEGKVVFLKYGDRYVLQQVWEAGKASHLQCVNTKKQGRDLAAVEAAPARVELALLDGPR